MTKFTFFDVAQNITGHSMRFGHQNEWTYIMHESRVKKFVYDITYLYNKKFNDVCQRVTTYPGAG